jgi:hypothetical protein
MARLEYERRGLIMADDAASMQGQLDALKAAYRTGASSISYEGKSISYKTGAEMLAAINSLERSLGIDTRPRRAVVRTDKGW